MRNTAITGVALLVLAGCSGGPAPQPTKAPTKAPMATASPVASATPTASASPAATSTPVASTDISSEEGISKLRDLIDNQVKEKVLTSKEVTDGDKVITIWSGEDGIRRIDVNAGAGKPVHEKAQYYYQGKHLFSFGGSGARMEGDKEQKYTFWAGIAADEKLVGPPFQFVGGKPAPYPEDDVREREDAGIHLHQKYAN